MSTILGPFGEGNGREGPMLRYIPFFCGGALGFSGDFANRRSGGLSFVWINYALTYVLVYLFSHLLYFRSM